MRHVPARTVMVTGAGALLGGVAVVLTGLALRSAPVFFAGATIAGVGFGAGFQGAIRSVVPLAAPSERAGVLCRSSSRSPTSPWACRPCSAACSPSTAG
jgi:hypothetical protein